MVWSHLSTMCRDPGFIPLGYKYEVDKLDTSIKYQAKNLSMVEGPIERSNTGTM